MFLVGVLLEGADVSDVGLQVCHFCLYLFLDVLVNFRFDVLHDGLLDCGYVSCCYGVVFAVGVIAVSCGRGCGLWLHGWVGFCVLGGGGRFLVDEGVGEVVGVIIVVELSGSVWFGRFVEPFCLLRGCVGFEEIDFTFEGICVCGHCGGLRAVIGPLRDWMVDVGDKRRVFADVIGEHWHQIVVEPLSAFL